MTTASYRLKLARANALKIKVNTHIPAQLVGGTGIEITKTNGVYTADLDFEELSTFSSFVSPQDTTTFLPAWESSGDTYKRISLSDIRSELQIALTPEAYGAVGDGVTDDTAAFQAAILYLNTIGGGTLTLGAKTYLITASLPITSNGVYIRGAGAASVGAATTIKFQPSIDSACILVSGGASSIWGGGISDVRFYSTDSTHSKYAIQLEDIRGFVLDNVTVEGGVLDAGINTYLWSGGAASVGLVTKGREFLQSNNLCINADLPIQIVDNPNTSGATEISADFFSFHNTRLIAGSAFSGILISGGTQPSNMSFTGYLWIGGGTHGIDWQSTTMAAYSHNLYIENMRCEQGQSATSYNILINHTLRGLRGLTIVNAEFDGRRRGVFLAGVRGAVLINPKYDPITATIALAVDSTVEGLRITGGKWFAGTTASIAGLSLHESAPIPSGMSSAIPPEAYYSPSASPMAFGVPIAVASGGTGAATARAAQAALKGVYILASSAVASSITGTLTETTLATITIPANAMGANGRVRFATVWSFTNSANNKILRHKFGGTAYNTFTLTTTASGRIVTEIQNRNATNSQSGFASGVGAGTTGAGLGFSTAANVTSAIDTTAAVDILLTAQLANTGETITLESYLVELIVP